MVHLRRQQTLKSLKDDPDWDPVKLEYGHRVSLSTVQLMTMNDVPQQPPASDAVAPAVAPTAEQASAD